MAKRKCAPKRPRANKRKLVFPGHSRAYTPEQWRSLKRQEWREIEYALSRFNYGSAYVPAQTELYKLHTLVEQIGEAVRAEDWIAW